MAKKKQEIKLTGFDDIDFSKTPDIEAAQSVITNAPTKDNSKDERPSVEEKKKERLPAVSKKRTSFNLDPNLHRALKDYCYYEDVDMVEYVFEQLVKSDLKNKGYFPPKKRKK